MGIKRLLLVGIILAGSIATPGWATMINDDRGSGEIDLWNIGPSSPNNATRVIIDWRVFGSFDWGALISRFMSSSMNLPGDGGTSGATDSRTDSRIELPNDAATANHVTDFHGRDHGVPEPGVLGLLGIGLISIILRRRCLAA